jgi:quercetin dioxygenase-like cupin family protein
VLGLGPVDVLTEDGPVGRGEMPFEPTETALNRVAIGVDRVIAEAGLAPWSVCLVASPRVRVVALALSPGVRPAHHHPYADEVFQVLAGTCGITIGTNPEVTATPGTLLVAEKGTRHQVRVLGPDPVVLLCTVTPNDDRPDEQVND